MKDRSEYWREYSKANREHRREYQRAWRAANRAKVNAYQREWSANKRGTEVGMARAAKPKPAPIIKPAVKPSISVPREGNLLDRFLAYRKVVLNA